ncbi:MAG: glycerol-3-phosphate 1-O-acyltransferase PlsY [Gammaproteobacteria bacterium]|nr:glycerol-3-phosphate 1-O-acyltransferase PlsY [Gammaproteobacteria bacterium]
MLELLIKAVLAYLLGSLVGSLILGRLLGGVDIRTQGSGNAGATNAMRILGRRIALAVFVIDFLKGWAATGLLARATLPLVTPAEAALAAWNLPVCGIAAMLGHVYPLWFGLRGGKGVATLVGVMLGISLAWVGVFALGWIVTVLTTGYVGLASMIGALAVAVFAALGAQGSRGPLVAFALVAALLVIYTHRANIGRMRAHTESRARKLWLLGARRG